MSLFSNQPNETQLQYVQIIQKLDPGMDPSTMAFKVLDFKSIEEEYEKALAEAKNNYEKKKIERELEQKRLLNDHIIQIKFFPSQLDHEHPFYFQAVPLVTSNGSVLEKTITTLIPGSFTPIYFGRIFQSKRYHQIFVSAARNPNPELCFEEVDPREFETGDFIKAPVFAENRRDLGVRVLTWKEKVEESQSSELIQRLYSDKMTQKFLAKFLYLSGRQYRPVELPKLVVGFKILLAECVGCILPTKNNFAYLQVGDFMPTNKTLSVRFMKHLVPLLRQ